ncbi:DUF6241 domain-containing protein [Cytobacillus horneckiae]|uniref:DUF6241 domain-containing protein n=1 Tax=Cytobacillus horneckiae TaxID=549687 RepID=UPI003D9A4170
MKKFLLAALIVVVCLAGLLFGVKKLTDNAKSYERKKEEAAQADQAFKELADRKAPETVLTPEQQLEEDIIARISAIKFQIDWISKNSTQEEIIDVMHQMTHQKVRAEKKEGAIPMSHDTIAQVYQIVVNSDFERKADLLAMLEQWKIGNFSSVDSDHNYFWEYQGGSSGMAYGRLSLAEEEAFIKENFKLD